MYDTIWVIAYNLTLYISAFDNDFETPRPDNSTYNTYVYLLIGYINNTVFSEFNFYNNVENKIKTNII